MAALSSVPTICRPFASTKANKRRSTDMPIKYASTPQLHYGQQSGGNVWARFPQGSRPIATLADLAPVIGIKRDGQQKYVWARNGSIRELGRRKNWKDGSGARTATVPTIAWRGGPSRRGRKDE